MAWSWQIGPKIYETAQHEDHELHLILAPHNQSIQAAKLEERCLASLRQEIEGLSLGIGFLDTEGKKPFVLASWPPGRQDFLEKRWVWSQALRRLEAQLKFQKLTVWTDPAIASTEHRLLCEDLASLLQQSLPGRIEALEVCSLTEWDESWLKQQNLRFERRLAYADWINESPDIMTSITIGARLQDFAKTYGCEFEVLDESRLKEERMNLLLAVGSASESSPSRCYTLTHKLDGKRQPLMLVGKGITFDTGGINVKPFESHVNAMRNDMGGAALMAQLFMGLVEAGYDQPLVLVIPCCENAISPKAMKPGSIVRSRQGKQVYVEHTDAEGRLILADAIDYGEVKFDPKLTMVAATLTTAALRQFTNYVTPVYFAADSFKKTLQAKGEQHGEEFVFWKEFIPFHRANQTMFGDLTNMGRLPHHANIGGGSHVAAHFLKQFSKKPFIHLDIFASTWNWSGDYPGSIAGATGAPYNSLFASLMEPGPAF